MNFEKNYETLSSALNGNEEILKELAEEAVEKGIKYFKMRLDWAKFTKEQKMEKDELRTMMHNGFIDSLTIFNRYATKINTTLIDGIEEDRKVIGDFACYIAYQTAVGER